MHIKQLLSIDAAKKQLIISIAFGLAIMLIYFMPTPTVKQTGKNVAIVELVFCWLYLYLSGVKFKQLLPNISSHKIIYALASLTILSLGYSYTSFVIDNSQSSSAIRYSSYQVIFIIAHTFFGVTACHFWLHKANCVRKNILVVPVLCGVMALLYFIYTYLTSPSMQPDDGFHSPPLGSHIRNIGWLINISSVSSLILLLYTKATIKQFLFYFLLSTLCMTFLFWTGGRAALASFVLCAFIIVLASLYHKKSLKKALTLFILLPVAAVISNFYALSEHNGVARSQKAVEITTSEVNLNSLTAGRFYMWSESINKIIDAPFFGYGPNAYLRETPELYGSQPHNFIIQLLYDWGIVGSASIFMLFVYWLYISARLLIRSNLEVSALQAISIFILLLSNAFFSGTLYHAQALFFFSLAVAGLTASNLAQKRQKTN